MMEGIIVNKNVSPEGVKAYFEREFEILCEVLPDDLEESSCFLKNLAFKEEQEVRR